MAAQRPDPPSSNLALRLRSAALFVPATFGAIYFGFPWFDALVVLCAVLMAWEWTRICCNGAFGPAGWLMEAGLLGAIGALYLDAPVTAAAILAVSILGQLVIGRRARRGDPAFLVLGAVLVGMFGLSFLWLRAHPDGGRDVMIWLVCAVWLTDTGAYVFGRLIGGARLAPRISPKKTWAGLIGGMQCAVSWSAAWQDYTGKADLVAAVFAAIALALLAQAGDLTVSVAKRRFGVKDASRLLPGHGGVLDRLDGMLLTGPATALVLISAEKGWI